MRRHRAVQFTAVALHQYTIDRVYLSAYRFLPVAIHITCTLNVETNLAVSFLYGLRLPVIMYAVFTHCFLKYFVIKKIGFSCNIVAKLFYTKSKTSPKR